MEPLQADVRRLVRQLDSPQLAEREAAEAELLRRGPAILDLLPPPGDRASAEVRQRLGRIRQKLQQQAAEAAAKSSTITLQADAMPLANVLAAFQRQSGNKIVDGRDGNLRQPAADPETESGLRQNALLAGAGPLVGPGRADGLSVFRTSGDRGGCRRRAAKPIARVGRACYVGPFRIEPTAVMARRDLRQPAGEQLVVTLEVAWEPRLRIIASHATHGRREGRGRTGPGSAGGQPRGPTGNTRKRRGPGRQLDLPLRLPSRRVERVASLKGKLLAMIPGRIETFRFTKLAGAKDIQRRIAGVTVTLEEVRKNNESWEVRILARFDDAGDALASHRTWIFNNEAYLEGPDGKPIAYGTYETTRQGKNEVGVAYIFDPDEPLDKLASSTRPPA